jgi:hypothetical protein
VPFGQVCEGDALLFFHLQLGVAPQRRRWLAA